MVKARGFLNDVEEEAAAAAAEGSSLFVEEDQA
jgi:hypothetical protein